MTISPYTPFCKKWLWLKYILVSFIFSQCTSPTIYPLDQAEQGLSISSSDTLLVNRFQWAKNQALSYVHQGEDSVGLWYEAALPNREAFCMRDVSHQSIGAHFLGLQAHTLNMMQKFAKNISESKDWCTYWEINRYNQPAPVDYRNDQEFWYNLPANFDVIQACYQQFRWTRDSTYLMDQDLQNFYQKSLNEYIDRWNLKIDDIPNRERFLNVRVDSFNHQDAFHTCRGLPSYEESAPDLTLGADLQALQYQAYLAYSSLNDYIGDIEQSRHYLARAEALKTFFNHFWWNSDQGRYYTFIFDDGHMEARPLRYLLNTGIVTEIGRYENALSDLIGFDSTNVESMSYFPQLFYEWGRPEEAYHTMMQLSSPEEKRRSYPEVPFAVIESIVHGMLGLEPDPKTNTISTFPRLSSSTDWVEVSNIPIWDKQITLLHKHNTQTQLTLEQGTPFTWKVYFPFATEKVLVNGQTHATSIELTRTGEKVAYITLNISKGETVVVSIE